MYYWIYYILFFMVISFVFRLIGPFILPILAIYLIYTFIKNRQRLKTMKDLHDASKRFKEEWDNTTKSEAYNSSPNDVIDAEYTIKED